MEMESEENNVSMRYLFVVAQQQYEEIEKSSLSGAELQPKIKECITKMKRVKELVYRNSLFSSNEELEDVSTSSLRYLLVDYYLGYLHTQLFTQDIHLQELKLAKMFLSSFLQLCGQYKLIHKEDVKTIQRESKADAATIRVEKISRAKREKEISQKLQELLKKQKEGNIKSEKGYIQSKEEEEDEDEETSRNIYSILIQSCVFKAINLLDSTNQEIEMLQHVEKLKKENNGKLPPPPERTTPPFKNYTILPNQRIELLDQVFVNRNPATMTPEQWAEDQMRRGLLPTPEGYEKEKAEQIKKKQEEEEKQDTDEAVDRQTMKDRETDEWKDNTPKGIGNKNDNYFKRS